jgi:hypothetical protein
MKTKPFTNMFGREIQVTRNEYAKRWQDKLFDLGNLFMGSEHEQEFISMLHHTYELASKKWEDQ